ncbi:15638_t:CDS:1, partial [Cetraspora pellucida]
IRDNMTSFHDIMCESNWEMRVLAFLLEITKANAFLSFKKWHEEAYNVSHFDFRQQLALEILNEEYLNLRNSSPNLFKKCSRTQAKPLHKLSPLAKRKKTRNITIYS